MNKRYIQSIAALLSLFVVASTVMAVGCGSDKAAVSGKSIFETPTPSIFDEPKTRTPEPRVTAPPAPVSTEPPAPETTTPAPPPPPPPTSPPPAAPTPAPATPTPVPAAPTPPPAPTTFTLTLKLSNPDFGTVTIDPKAPDNRYETGTTISLYALAGAGSKFNGWTGDASGTSNSVFVTMDGNKTVQADFAKLSFPVTVNPPTGGTIALTPDWKSFDHGSKVTARAVPGTGFSFKSWTGDAAGTENPVIITVDREKRIGAEFVKAEYALNVKVDPAGFVDATPAGSRHDGGTVVTLTARTSPVGNWRFVGWSGDASGSGPTVTVTMDADKNITAKFARQFTLNIVVQPAGAGTVQPTSGMYDEGAEVILTATPAAGWEFEGYGGGQGITGSALTMTISMNWDKGAIASFRPR
ncbi:MAG: hypothetical protein HY673_08700 [Chloroflexi bacterium]|nr:hypothetical protein [Chloroflexota bacterium]